MDRIISRRTLLLAGAGAALSAHLPVLAAGEGVPAGPPRAISPRIVGINGGWVFTYPDGWQSESLRHALRVLKPGTLRYPGGTEANYWNWRTGGFFSGSNVPAFYQNVDVQPQGLADFRGAIQHTGATPVFVLNMLTDTLDSQLGMLRQAQALGMPVHYVELGNEFYLNGFGYEATFPTAAEYGSEATRWISAIRSAFPHVRIAAVGATAGGGPRRRNWTAGVLQTLRGADALTFHLYVGPKSQPVGGYDPLAVMAAAFGAWSQLKQQLAHLPAGMRAWDTEYDLSKASQHLHGTWMHGLFVAAETLLFLRDPRVTMLEPYTIEGNALHGALFANDHGFAFSGSPTPTDPPATDAFALSAYGLCWQAIRRASAGMTTARELHFPAIPQLTAPDGTTFPAVLAWEFSHRTMRRLALLNHSATPITLPASSLGPRLHAATSMSADPFTPITGGNVDVHPHVLGRSLTLPAYSLTTVR